MTPIESIRQQIQKGDRKFLGSFRPILESLAPEMGFSIHTDHSGPVLNKGGEQVPAVKIVFDK
jgi:hypothetical protein